MCVCVMAVLGARKLGDSSQYMTYTWSSHSLMHRNWPCNCMVTAQGTMMPYISRDIKRALVAHHLAGHMIHTGLDTWWRQGQEATPHGPVCMNNRFAIVTAVHSCRCTNSWTPSAHPGVDLLRAATAVSRACSYCRSATARERYQDGRGRQTQFSTGLLYRAQQVTGRVLHQPAGGYSRCNCSWYLADVAPSEGGNPPRHQVKGNETAQPSTAGPASSQGPCTTRGEQMTTTGLNAARGSSWAEGKLPDCPTDEQQHAQLLASLADQLLDCCTRLRVHPSQMRVWQAATCLLRAVQTVLQEQQQGLGLMHEAILAACYNLADALAKAVAVMESPAQLSTVASASLHAVISALPLTPLSHLLHIVEMCGGITGKRMSLDTSNMDASMALRQRLQQQQPGTKCIIAACCISSALQQFTDGVETSAAPDAASQHTSSKSVQDQASPATLTAVAAPVSIGLSSAAPTPFISALLAGLLGENLEGDGASCTQLRACESTPGALDWSSSTTTNSLLIPAYCLSMISGHHSISSSGYTSSQCARTATFDSSSGHLQPLASSAMDSCWSNISMGTTANSGYGHGISAVRISASSIPPALLGSTTPDDWSMGAPKKPPAVLAGTAHTSGGPAVWNRGRDSGTKKAVEMSAAVVQAGSSSSASSSSTKLPTAHVIEDSAESTSQGSDEPVSGHGVGNASELQAFKQMLRKASRPPRYQYPAATAAATEPPAQAAAASADMHVSPSQPLHGNMHQQHAQMDLGGCKTGLKRVGEGRRAEVEVCIEEDDSLPELTHPSQICGRACCDGSPAAPPYLTVQDAAGRQARRKRALKALSSLIQVGSPTVESPDVEAETFTCSMNTPWAISERGSTASSSQPNQPRAQSSARAPSAVLGWLCRIAQQPCCLPSLLLVSATMQLMALAVHVYTVASFGSLYSLKSMFLGSPLQYTAHAVIMLAVVAATVTWSVVASWQYWQQQREAFGISETSAQIGTPSIPAEDHVMGQVLPAGHLAAPGGKHKLTISLPTECIRVAPIQQHVTVFQHTAPCARCPAWLAWLFICCPGLCTVTMPIMLAWQWVMAGRMNSAATSTPFSVSVATSSSSGAHSPTSLETPSSPDSGTDLNTLHDVEAAQPVTQAAAAPSRQVCGGVKSPIWGLTLAKVCVHAFLEAIPCLIAAAVSLGDSSHKHVDSNSALNAFFAVLSVDASVLVCTLLLVIMQWASKQQVQQQHDSKGVPLQFPDLQAASLQFSDLSKMSKEDKSPRVSPSYEVPSGFVQNI